MTKKCSGKRVRNITTLPVFYYLKHVHIYLSTNILVKQCEINPQPRDILHPWWIRSDLISIPFSRADRLWTKGSATYLYGKDDVAHICRKIRRLVKTKQKKKKAFLNVTQSKLVHILHENRKVNHWTNIIPLVLDFDKEKRDWEENQTFILEEN